MNRSAPSHVYLAAVPGRPKQGPTLLQGRSPYSASGEQS